MKRLFLCVSLLLCTAEAVNSTHEHQSTTHTVTHSALLPALQDIASAAGTTGQPSALTSLIEQLSSGAFTADIQVIQQALQEALQLLTAAGGRLNPLVILEYTALLVEMLAELEKPTPPATSLIVTSTH